MESSIRITRTITLTGVMFDDLKAFTVREGDVLTGPLTVTDAGNALIGLAYDDPVVVPRGAFEVVS